MNEFLSAKSVTHQHFKHAQGLAEQLDIGDLILLAPGDREKHNIVTVVVRCENHAVVERKIIREPEKEFVFQHLHAVHIEAGTQVVDPFARTYRKQKIVYPVPERPEA
jgi:hypothetical protein